MNRNSVLLLTFYGLLFTAGAACAQVRSISELLRERLEQLDTTGRIDVGESAIISRHSLSQIYEANGYQPFWSPPDLAVLSRLIADAGQDGLNPADYHARDLGNLLSASAASDPMAKAQINLLATDAFYLLLYHIYFGKVNPVSVDPAWNFDKRSDVGPDIAPVVSNALTQRRGWLAVPAGDTMKVGTRGSRVIALRNRLAVTGEFKDQKLDGEVFDDALAAAVRRFQANHRITADGVAGAGTLKELNIHVASRIGQIRQTPIFKSAIDHVVFNPTWTVPPGILQSDILPAIRKTPMR